MNGEGMDVKETRIKIGRLLDDHCRPCRYHHQRRMCELCPIYFKLRRLGDSLVSERERHRGAEIERILDKRERINAWDVMRLYELGADHEDIADVLGIPLSKLGRYKELYIRPLLASGQAAWEGEDMDDKRI